MIFRINIERLVILPSIESGKPIQLVLDLDEKDARELIEELKVKFFIEELK